MTILLETILAEAFGTIARAKTSTIRNLQFPTADNMIKVAVGMRRSGKTYFLYQTINNLLSQGVPQSQILFINFEDERLLPMNAKSMGQLIDTFYEIYPENHNKKCSLFFDEVQNVTDWHLVIRRYFDSKNVQIYLTGSSAKLLSKEINTSLRGRALSVEVLPYSFNEYLAAHKVTTPETPFGKDKFDFFKQKLQQYFSTGGFPAVQNMQKNEWRETLQSYIDTVILRDIIDRHNVTNITILKYLTNSLLKNTSSTFAVNKFYNDVKSQGYKISKDTVYNYLKYIKDAFLIFDVEFYSESERIRQTKPKKIYAIDCGIVNAISMQTNPQHGKFLENLVYLDLRRQGKKVYYYQTQNGYGIDFITIDRENHKELIQVSWNIDDKKTLEREQRSLSIAEQELGINGRIITAYDYLKNT